MPRHWLKPHLRTGSEEQAACRDFWERAGGIVYTTSDRRQTLATPGISDLLVFLPRKSLLIGWESKAGSEQYPPHDPRRLSDEQRIFGALMARGYTTAFGSGDAPAAQRWMEIHKRASGPQRLA